MAHGHGWTDALSGLGSYFFSLGLFSHPYDRNKIEQVDVKITIPDSQDTPHRSGCFQEQLRK